MHETLTLHWQEREVKNLHGSNIYSFNKASKYYDPVMFHAHLLKQQNQIKLPALTKLTSETKIIIYSRLNVLNVIWLGL